MKFFSPFLSVPLDGLQNMNQMNILENITSSREGQKVKISLFIKKAQAQIQGSDVKITHLDAEKFDVLMPNIIGSSVAVAFVYNDKDHGILEAFVTPIHMAIKALMTIELFSSKLSEKQKQRIKQSVDAVKGKNLASLLTPNVVVAFDDNSFYETGISEFAAAFDVKEGSHQHTLHYDGFRLKKFSVESNSLVEKEESVGANTQEINMIGMGTGLKVSFDDMRSYLTESLYYFKPLLTILAGAIFPDEISATIIGESAVNILAPDIRMSSFYKEHGISNIGTIKTDSLPDSVDIFLKESIGLSVSPAFSILLSEDSRTYEDGTDVISFVNDMILHGATVENGKLRIGSKVVSSTRFSKISNHEIVSKEDAAKIARYFIFIQSINTKWKFLSESNEFLLTFGDREFLDRFSKYVDLKKE